MSETDQLLATLQQKDFVHFNLQFKARYPACVERIERNLTEPLTPRERTVCYLTLLGESAKDIAPLLIVSVSTVKTYSKYANRKLHLDRGKQHWLKTALLSVAASVG